MSKQIEYERIDGYNCDLPSHQAVAANLADVLSGGLPLWASWMARTAIGRERCQKLLLAKCRHVSIVAGKPVPVIGVMVHFLRIESKATALGVYAVRVIFDVLDQEPVATVDAHVVSGVHSVILRNQLPSERLPLWLSFAPVRAGLGRDTYNVYVAAKPKEESKK